MTAVSDRMEKIVGKGANAGHEHSFQKAYFSGSLKVGIMCSGVNLLSANTRYSEDYQEYITAHEQLSRKIKFTVHCDWLKQWIPTNQTI